MAQTKRIYLSSAGAYSVTGAIAKGRIDKGTTLFVTVNRAASSEEAAFALGLDVAELRAEGWIISVEFVVDDE